MNSDKQEIFPESMELILETSEGAVWHSPAGGHFWIQFGNIRWRMDRECLAPYRNYLRSVLEAIAIDLENGQSAFIKTKDPSILLSFTRIELTGLVFLLDAAESIYAIENTKPA